MNKLYIIQQTLVSLILSTLNTTCAFELSSSRFGQTLSKKINDQTTTTQLFGLDYDAINDDEECEFIVRPIDATGIDALKQEPTCIKLESPQPSISAEEVVRICMKSLQNNNEPFLNAGRLSPKSYLFYSCPC